MATLGTENFPDPTALDPAGPAAQRCDCCQAVGAASARLTHEGTGVTIHSCLRCLRSVMQMRVYHADWRGRRIIHQSADELGWHVWTAEDALYLLPVVDPFVPAST